MLLTSLLLLCWLATSHTERLHQPLAKLTGIIASQPDNTVSLIETVEEAPGLF
jgi:hypothetical protein